MNPNDAPSYLDFPCVECGAREGYSCLRFASSLEDPQRRVPTDPHDARKLAVVKFRARPCTFRVICATPGEERVYLDVDGQPWNAFSGPVARAVVALLKRVEGA